MDIVFVLNNIQQGFFFNFYFTKRVNISTIHGQNGIHNYIKDFTSLTKNKNMNWGLFNVEDNIIRIQKFEAIDVSLFGGMWDFVELKGKIINDSTIILLENKY